MKKILVIVAALMLAAACAAPPTNREATAPVNASSPAEVAITEADAITKEKAIWDTIKNKDYDGFAAMLATDQMEVMPEGVMDKAGSVEGVKQFEPSEVNFSDWKYLAIDKDAFVIMYTVAVKGKFQGKEFKPETARASSAWVKRAGKWLAVYHQECEVKPAMMMPASKAEKAAPSPTAPPAAAPATGPDPIANEKIVWDLFKAKNYPAFADLLAPNFVEVEEDAVYDRAGSIKGVSMFDASKAVLSDWKAVNLDDDAALVTYTVKNAGPPSAPLGVRHSTIWVKLNGTWMGLFHHGGTPVRMPQPKPAASPAAKTP
jgi:hypothetical protein